MIDEASSLDVPTAVRFAYAACLRPSFTDELAEAESNQHGITICNEQDHELVIIVYEELPLFRTFLAHYDKLKTDPE